MSLKLALFKPVARGLLGLALLAASGAAMALGLGEIRVKSQPGQPLVAEIPVVSSEPGELEQLRARLASPEIFERVGLQRPTGLVGQLDFAVALSDDGKPVIRVTSQDPVDTAAVNFLIEVDWGQGRLVREYSALVGTPGALAAADAPQIQAPDPSPSSRIERPAAPAAPAPLPGQADESVASERPSSAVPVPAPRADTSAPAALAAPAAGAATVSVQQGQSLSQIARGLQQGGTLDQTMIALLRANPQAFIGNNINRLRSGALLRVPPASEATALAAAEAAAMVRQQVSDWRQARQTVPQPAGASGAAPIPVANGAPAVAGARLEIAPPAADAAQRAGTTSGTEAGGEGDMLANEQLRQTKEDLAARSAEVQELRTQVAELEKLKAQQAQLIAMKDSDLAAAQKRLGQTQGEAGVPAWLWIGAVLVIVGLLAWVLLRRNRGPRPAPVYKGALVVPAAATGPAGVGPAASGPVEAAVPGSVPQPARYAPVYVAADANPGTEPAPTAAAAPAWMNTATARPTWHTVDGPQPAVTRIGSGISPPAPIADAVPAIAPSAGSRERLELAIAYLDLGDTEAARSLLQQVAAGDDRQARDEADKLLRELG
jgi:pilus assembly protein FimV